MLRHGRAAPGRVSVPAAMAGSALHPSSGKESVPVSDSAVVLLQYACLSALVVCLFDMQPPSPERACVTNCLAFRKGNLLRLARTAAYTKVPAAGLDAGGDGRKGWCVDSWNALVGR